MARAPLLQLSGISLTFGGNPVFDELDLVVQPGDRVALVGRNHPFGILFAALLFATLSQGGLAVNALVPKQLTDILTAVVILAVATAVPEVQKQLRAAAAATLAALTKSTRSAA